MGDRYSWDEPCPKCGETMSVYYAESCGITTVTCPKCQEKYEIELVFRLKALSDGRSSVPDYEECASCGEPVLRAEAFKEGRQFYHPDCAGVWRCPVCGNFFENGEQACRVCGAKKAT